MANMGDRIYRVNIIATEIVASALPMQEHWLPQSNIDLILPPVDVSVFICYQNRATTKPSFASVVASLKKSLSEVLVSYYAFAGRLVTNSNGEPELLCNNEGVEFSEAYADIRLAQVDFHNPDATVEGKIVPSRSPFPDENNDRVAVFCVQVTKFKCGSVVVEYTFDHRVADAHSANVFMVSWSEVCRNQSISSISTCCKLLPLKTGRSNAANWKASALICGESSMLQPMMKKIKEEIGSIKRMCRLGVVVDGRSRLEKVKVAATYFGNLVSLPYAEACVGEAKGVAND
eukprot:Gb_17586 [translate_table: standard]